MRSANCPGYCGRLFPGTDEEDEAGPDARRHGGGAPVGGPGQVLAQGAKLLGQSPELGRLTDEIRGRLLEAGKGAAVAVATRQVEALTDRLVTQLGTATEAGGRTVSDVGERAGGVGRTVGGLGGRRSGDEPEPDLRGGRARPVRRGRVGPVRGGTLRGSGRRGARGRGGRAARRPRRAARGRRGGARGPKTSARRRTRRARRSKARRSPRPRRRRGREGRKTRTAAAPPYRPDGGAR